MNPVWNLGVLKMLRTLNGSEASTGKTMGVEASSIELVVLFVQYGIDDGRLALLGLLDGLLAHHHLDAPAGMVVLLFESSRPR